MEEVLSFTFQSFKFHVAERQKQEEVPSFTFHVAERQRQKQDARFRGFEVSMFRGGRKAKARAKAKARYTLSYSYDRQSTNPAGGSDFAGTVGGNRGNTAGHGFNHGQTETFIE